jgi:uncharacterized membrane protein YccC
MNPLIDQLLVGLAIGGAISFFLLRLWRRKAAAKACGSDCCTTSKSAATRKDQLSSASADAKNGGIAASGDSLPRA